MNAPSIFLPALSQTVGDWRAVYWEPVMGSGERICVGCITTFDGRTKAHKALKPGVLSCMYGAAGATAEAVLDRGFALLGRLSESLDAGSMRAPLVGIQLGDVATAHVSTEQDLVQIALLMSSSMCNLSDPGQLDSSEVASDGDKRVSRQFLTRVRAAVSQRRPELAGYFNVEAKLLTKKRPVRFGFLSDKLVAHLGLLQATNLNATVRNARGLMTEVRMAHVARDTQGSAALVIGHPPLNSANLSTKERDALEDSIDELRAEAAELHVALRSGDTDESCAEELLSLH